MRLVHLDNSFLVRALSSSGLERRRLHELSAGESHLEMSVVAWYEFCRGPRTPQQLAVGRSLFPVNGIVSLSEPIAERAADIFRQLGSPRRRAADILIAATALWAGARLATGNPADFADIPDLALE